MTSQGPFLTRIVMSLRLYPRPCLGSFWHNPASILWATAAQVHVLYGSYNGQVKHSSALGIVWGCEVCALPSSWFKSAGLSLASLQVLQQSRSFSLLLRVLQEQLPSALSVRSQILPRPLQLCFLAPHSCLYIPPFDPNFPNPQSPRWEPLSP